MAELMLAGGDVVTMNAGLDVITDGAVVVAGPDIVAVGTRADLAAAHPDATVIDTTGCVITPGLINGHQHFTGDPLIACCIPDGIGSDSAIFDWAVPIHEHHTADDDEVAATLTALQCLRHGTTTAIEAGTVAHPDRVAAGMTAAGIRGTVGRWGWDVPDVPYSAPVDEVLDGQRAVVERFPAGGLVEGWVTLVGHDLASDALFAGAAELSRNLGVGFTMHMSPTPNDSASIRQRSGRSAVAHLDDLDVLGPNLLLAHAIWLDDDEWARLLANDVAVAYCPAAYLRLGQGVTREGRHDTFVRSGGRLAFGCDAANAGDHRDLLAVAALAAGLARDRTQDPTFGAAVAFDHATRAGAAAIGKDDRLGSLEVGKAADVVVFDETHLDWGARGDLALQLVWGNIGHTVRDVLVNGEAVIRQGRSTKVDEGALLEQARQRKTSLLHRAGITVPTTWP